MQESCSIIRLSKWEGGEFSFCCKVPTTWLSETRSLNFAMKCWHMFVYDTAEVCLLRNNNANCRYLCEHWFQFFHSSQVVNLFDNFRICDSFSHTNVGHEFNAMLLGKWPPEIAIVKLRKGIGLEIYTSHCNQTQVKGDRHDFKFKSQFMSDNFWDKYYWKLNISYRSSLWREKSSFERDDKKAAAQCGSFCPPTFSALWHYNQNKNTTYSLHLFLAVRGRRRWRMTYKQMLLMAAVFR